MSHRIAFASSDGKVVNQHFGRTQKIIVVDLLEDDYNFVEVRENTLSCVEFEHTEERLLNTVNLIKDCEAIFVAKIGKGALSVLQRNGIKAVESPHFIVDIIDNLLHGRVKLINL